MAERDLSGGSTKKSGGNLGKKKSTWSSVCAPELLGWGRMSRERSQGWDSSGRQRQRQQRQRLRQRQRHFPLGRCNPFVQQPGRFEPRSQGRARTGSCLLCLWNCGALGSAPLLSALFILPTARGNGSGSCTVNDSLPPFISARSLSPLSIAAHYRDSLSRLLRPGMIFG